MLKTLQLVGPFRSTPASKILVHDEYLAIVLLYTAADVTPRTARASTAASSTRRTRVNYTSRCRLVWFLPISSGRHCVPSRLNKNGKSCSSRQTSLAYGPLKPTAARDRKRMLRLLIRDITVTKGRSQSCCDCIFAGRAAPSKRSSYACAEPRRSGSLSRCLRCSHPCPGSHAR